VLVAQFLLILVTSLVIIRSLSQGFPFFNHSSMFYSFGTVPLFPYYYLCALYNKHRAQSLSQKGTKPDISHIVSSVSTKAVMPVYIAKMQFDPLIKNHNLHTMFPGEVL